MHRRMEKVCTDCKETGQKIQKERVKVPLKETTLTVASGRGHVECVRALLDDGADVNAHEWLRGAAPMTTSLMAATRSKNVDCVRLLINAGADINYTNLSDGNALETACMSGCSECVKLLLDAGARTETPGDDACRYCKPDRYTSSGLYYAALHGYPEIVQMLLEAGADVNGKGDSEAPLILAALGECFGEAKSSITQYHQCLELLVKAGADVNARGRAGRTPLTAASFDETKVEILIKARADVNTRNVGGSTALMHAATHGNATCVRLLLDAGALVNVRDSDGRSALMYAATGDLIFDLPSNICLSPSGCDQEWQLQSMIAKVTQVPISKEAGIVAEGTDECLKLLLAAGADVNQVDSTGSTALIQAASIPNRRCMELLIKAGANVNATDKNGKTALMRITALQALSFQRPWGMGLSPAALELVCTEALICVKLLLKAGARVDAVTPWGTNAFKVLENRSTHVPQFFHPYLAQIREAMLQHQARSLQEDEDETAKEGGEEEVILDEHINVNKSELSREVEENAKEEKENEQNNTCKVTEEEKTTEGDKDTTKAVKSSNAEIEIGNKEGKVMKEDKPKSKKEAGIEEKEVGKDRGSLDVAEGKGSQTKEDAQPRADADAKDAKSDSDATIFRQRVYLTQIPEFYQPF